mmetsp:Transcript_91707/g.137321  ORF Transcript_91707/g.137321 Transcript_91707/m.137321 type:complete len:246 (+) Transcript_91707:612-1349(+)
MTAVDKEESSFNLSKSADTSLPFSVILPEQGLAMFSADDDQDLSEVDLGTIPGALLSPTEQDSQFENTIFGVEQLLQMEPLFGESSDDMAEMDTYLTQAMHALGEEETLWSVIGGGDNDDEYNTFEHEEKIGNASSEHVFPRKLHLMLEEAEKNGFEAVVSWVEGGAAFKVHDSTKFVEEIMPTYFDQTKYESFRRQLNLYGFNRVSRGEGRGMYFHEFFLAGDKRLCRSVTRSSRSCTTSKARS